MMDNFDDQWLDLKKRLSFSKFRSSIRLSKKDTLYYMDQGEQKIAQHAREFIIQRLLPAFPHNDGKQTPYRGHPVFVAQHATATCCRSCLEKWHGIAKGRELSRQQRDYVVHILMSWLRDQFAH